MKDVEELGIVRGVGCTCGHSIFFFGRGIQKVKRKKARYNDKNNER